MASSSRLLPSMLSMPQQVPVLGPFDADARATAVFKITNGTGLNMAFKIKSTAVGRMAISPPKGFVKKGDFVRVTVTMARFTTNSARSIERLRVESVIVKDDDVKKGVSYLNDLFKRKPRYLITSKEITLRLVDTKNNNNNNSLTPGKPPSLTSTFNSCHDLLSESELQDSIVSVSKLSSSAPGAVTPGLLMVKEPDRSVPAFGDQKDGPADAKCFPDGMPVAHNGLGADSTDSDDLRPPVNSDKSSSASDEWAGVNTLERRASASPPFPALGPLSTRPSSTSSSSSTLKARTQTPSTGATTSPSTTPPNANTSWPPSKRSPSGMPFPKHSTVPYSRTSRRSSSSSSSPVSPPAPLATAARSPPSAWAMATVRGGSMSAPRVYPPPPRRSSASSDILTAPCSPPIWPSPPIRTCKRNVDDDDDGKEEKVSSAAKNRTSKITVEAGRGIGDAVDEGKRFSMLAHKMTAMDLNENNMQRVNKDMSTSADSTLTDAAVNTDLSMSSTQSSNASHLEWVEEDVQPRPWLSRFASFSGVGMGTALVLAGAGIVVAKILSKH